MYGDIQDPCTKGASTCYSGIRGSGEKCEQAFERVHVFAASLYMLLHVDGTGEVYLKGANGVD